MSDPVTAARLDAAIAAVESNDPDQLVTGRVGDALADLRDRERADAEQWTPDEILAVLDLPAALARFLSGTAAQMVEQAGELKRAQLERAGIPLNIRQVQAAIDRDEGDATATAIRSGENGRTAHGRPYVAPTEFRHPDSRS